MRWSNRGDEAEEKQRSSDEEEPEETQRRGDQDEAVHKQRRADEDKESPGLEHPGQNKKERPKRNDSRRRRKESRRTRLEHLGRNKQQGPPPPRTGASEDKWRPDAPDWIVRGGPSSRKRRPPRTGASGDQWRRTLPRLEHLGWNKQQAPRGAQKRPRG